MTFQLQPDGAEVYEKVLVPLWFGRWAAALVDLARPAPGQSILDVACGTGVTTRLLADAVGYTGRVVGLDINEAMLATAGRLSDGRGIDWLKSDVTDMPFTYAQFDTVIAQHGYHYFPDQPAALEEFRRVLRPGGTVALSIWTGHSAYTEALCRAVARHISPDIAAKQSAQRDCPTPEVLADDMRAAGFKDVDVVTQSLDINVPIAEEFVPLHLASMPIAGAFAALEDAARASLIADVREDLRDYLSGDRLIYPDSVNVMIGTA